MILVRAAALAALALAGSAAPAVGATPPAGSCTAEIGALAAKRLATECLATSGATHPPCGLRNSCAIIRSEIVRSCAIDSRKPADCAKGMASSPAALVELYYALLDGRNFKSAYLLWEGDGRASGKTLAGFTQGFAHTLTTAVHPGRPSRPEGAAGSTYVTLPVRVEALGDDRRPRRFTGSYVLRRSNVGADRDWHIHSASLHPG